MKTADRHPIFKKFLENNEAMAAERKQDDILISIRDVDVVIERVTEQLSKEIEKMKADLDSSIEDKDLLISGLQNQVDLCGEQIEEKDKMKIDYNKLNEETKDILGCTLDIPFTPSLGIEYYKHGQNRASKSDHLFCVNHGNREVVAIYINREDYKVYYMDSLPMNEFMVPCEEKEFQRAFECVYDRINKTVFST